MKMELITNTPTAMIFKLSQGMGITAEDDLRELPPHDSESDTDFYAAASIKF